jgi:WD40 repeat protein
MLLRQLPSGQIIARLRGEPGLQSLCFSYEGDELIAVFHPVVDSYAECLCAARICTWSRAADGRWPEAPLETVVPGAFDCLSSVKSRFLAVNNLPAHSVELLDTKTKALVHTVEYPKEWEGELVIALSVDNRLLVVGCEKAEAIELWDLKNWKSIGRAAIKPGGFMSFNLSPDGKHIACLSGIGGRSRIYATDGLQLEAEFEEFFDAPCPTQIAFAPEGTV